MLKHYQGRVAVCAIKVRLTIAEKGIEFSLSNMWTKSRPRVTDWFERIKARPSYGKAVTVFVTDADMKHYAGLDTWAWGKAEQLLKAA